MKNLIKFKNPIYLFFIVVCVLLFQSCIVYSPYRMPMANDPVYQPSVTVDDIVQMSKDGVSSKDIINEIKNSHTAYWLEADQLAKLQKDGVQDSVINYMEKTHLDAVRQNQRMQDSSYWQPGVDGYLYYGGLGFGFGWPYSIWGWNWGPAIIFSGHRYYGGGFRGGFHGGGFFRGALRR